MRAIDREAHLPLGTSILIIGGLSALSWMSFILVGRGGVVPPVDLTVRAQPSSCFGRNRPTPARAVLVRCIRGRNGFPGCWWEFTAWKLGAGNVSSVSV